MQRTKLERDDTRTCAASPFVECVTDIEGGAPLAYIVHAQQPPVRTTFHTPPECTLQLGHIVCPSGGQIQRHVHTPVRRELVGSAEVLMVQQGWCEVDIYSRERRLVDTRELHSGDIMIAVAGGHGFRMLADTVLVEVKQGPYPGLEEKVRF